MKTLQAEQKELDEVFTQYNFIIPDFQRPYSWKEYQCEQLWNDIVSFNPDSDEVENGEGKYFLGSIVIYPDPNRRGERSWCVIDGQQRLTTLMILIKVLLEMDKNMKILEEYIHGKDSLKRKITREKLRLKSEVQVGGGRDDRRDFENIMFGKNDSHRENPFKSNYDHLKKEVGKWGKEIHSEEFNKLISNLQNSFVFLVIECDSQEDALRLFEVINDRGMNLRDADIFKARIYSKVPQEEKEEFIHRWKELGNPDDLDFLFHMFMHISRAKKGNVSTSYESIRKYMTKEYLSKKGVNMASEWKSIMHTLEVCRWLYKGNVCTEKGLDSDEVIYQKILECHSNPSGALWQIPMYVFVHKYAERVDESTAFYLSPTRQAELIELLECSVKYYFIKGMLYPTVSSVKSTTYNVCATIARGGDHLSRYRQNILDKEDKIDILKSKLRDREDKNYQKYWEGLVRINSLLNAGQNRADYVKALHENVEIEHILPKNRDHYTEWDKQSHGEYLDNFGNLLLLEQTLNRKASDKQFKRKKEIYAESKLQDALDLSNQESDCWRKEDVENRHEKSIARLMDFFGDLFDK